MGPPHMWHSVFHSTIFSSKFRYFFLPCVSLSADSCIFSFIIKVKP